MRIKFFITTLVIATVASLVAACGGGATPEPQVVEKVVEKEVVVEVTAAPEAVKLVVLTHWGSEDVLEPMQAKFDEYMELNPHVTIEYQTVSFGELLPKITTSRVAEVSPDVVHFYNLWMPEFVKGGMLAVPPDEIVADVKNNYSDGSVDAVSYAGQIWGYPTEVNTYQLIYNKKLLEEAGYDNPPETWEELTEMACAIAETDSGGTITTAGFGLISGWDSGVVHPFLSLLWSNGGKYLSDDGTQALFNSPEGMDTLKLYTDMIENGCADPAMGQEDFVNGNVGMIIMANWWRAELQNTFADGYENVGVAPIPHSPNSDSATLQYNWLFGVDNGSANRNEAWKLVQWLNTPTGEGAASPMGDFLTSGLGAIPSRLSDQEALVDRYDDFLNVYVDSTDVAIPEPVVPGGQEAKTTLQTEIEAAWYGQKAGEAAINDASEEINEILADKQ